MKYWREQRMVEPVELGDLGDFLLGQVARTGQEQDGVARHDMEQQEVEGRDDEEGDQQPGDLPG